MICHVLCQPFTFSYLVQSNKVWHPVCQAVNFVYVMCWLYLMSKLYDCLSLSAWVAVQYIRLVSWIFFFTPDLYSILFLLQSSSLISLSSMHHSLTYVYICNYVLQTHAWFIISSFISVRFCFYLELHVYFHSLYNVLFIVVLFQKLAKFSDVIWKFAAQYIRLPMRCGKLFPTECIFRIHSKHARNIIAHDVIRRFNITHTRLQCCYLLEMHSLCSDDLAISRCDKLLFNERAQRWFSIRMLQIYYVNGHHSCWGAVKQRTWPP